MPNGDGLHHPAACEPVHACCAAHGDNYHVMHMGMCFSTRIAWFQLLVRLGESSTHLHKFCCRLHLHNKREVLPGWTKGTGMHIHKRIDDRMHTNVVHSSGKDSILLHPSLKLWLFLEMKCNMEGVSMEGVNKHAISSIRTQTSRSSLRSAGPSWEISIHSALTNAGAGMDSDIFLAC